MPTSIDTPSPSVIPLTIPQQKTFGSRTFPHVLTPSTSSTFPSSAEAVEWAKNNKDALRKQLVETGAILFRGFPVDSPKDFSDFVEALGVNPLPYVGGAAPRHTVYKDVHTTNESPPDQLIPFHHEMAQVPTYPKTIFFYCDLPPTEGGETPLCPSDIAVDRLRETNPTFVEKLEKKGIIYTRIIPEQDDPSSPIGRGWVSTFQTTSRVAAETAAQNLAVTLHWLPNGDVKTVSPVLPAVKTYNGKKVWFNSVVAAYLGWRDSRNDPERAVTYGDGEGLEKEGIEDMRRIMEEEVSVAVPWVKGDVVWIDNEQVLHARKTFVPPRKFWRILERTREEVWLYPFFKVQFLYSFALKLFLSRNCLLYLSFNIFVVFFLLKNVLFLTLSS
ncbi:hypothetical protein BC829DRAFT_129045 [Chytridium lagenaria]|nr:hypothetical protein BC829DRAFT_129045 [Chytridium lagenaria]